MSDNKNIGERIDIVLDKNDKKIVGKCDDEVNPHISPTTICL